MKLQNASKEYYPILFYLLFHYSKLPFPTPQKELSQMPSENCLLCGSSVICGNAWILWIKNGNHRAVT